MVSDWRAKLADNNVDLLTYVPENAFIARMKDTRLSTVAGLDFVQSVREYQPAFKIHPDLRRRLEATKRLSAVAAAPAVPVNVLLVPGATEQQLADVAKEFIGAPVVSAHKFGTIMRGSVSQTRLGAVAGSDAVLWLEPAGQPKLNDEVSSKIVAGDGGSHLTLTQSLGYNGSGVTVAVADSGLNNGDAPTMHPDLFGRVSGFFYYGALSNAADEKGHGTHVAGIIAGNGASGEVDDNGNLYGLGVAPGAGIVAQRIFDAGGFFQSPPSYGALTGDAVSAGASIGNNSWGTDSDGTYNLDASEFDALVRDAVADNVSISNTAGDQPYVLVFAAGNRGPAQYTISTPACAKNVIAVGGSQNDRADFFTYQDGPEAMADFSSRGPCADGRIKPDLVAPATWVASLKSASAPDSAALLPISSNYMYLQGTSQAAPHVSGAAAVFMQYYRQIHTNATPSPALVKAALINSAADMDNSFDTGPVPNMDEGWGRVNLAPLFSPDLRFRFLDQTMLLTTSQIFEQLVLISDTDSVQPLKITMAYTDVPGFSGANPALVNDLDLEVVAPDGKVFRGNQFDFNGNSVPSASGDRLNNVEGVLIPNPLPGVYTVRVRAVNVVMDARRDTPAVDQDFGLVVSGSIAAPGESVLFLDRQLVTAPGHVGVTVIDPDVTNGSVAVSASSGGEPGGEQEILFATSPGVFTGQVATATGPAQPDGLLQVDNDDYILIEYHDVSAGTNRQAIAVVDLVPPILTDVATTNSFGIQTVTWQSDKPSTSEVDYGTNSNNLSLTVSDPTLVQSHAVTLAGLVPGQAYYYKVISTDEAGNHVTNDNGGLLYSFFTPPVSPVLIVDGYIPDFASTNILLNVYTDALTSAGVGFDVWSVLQRNALPTADILAHYHVLIWRLNDSYKTSSSFSTLDANTQMLITNYLNSGGSFFLASMEILSRLGNVPFRANVLQVANFNANPDSRAIYCAGCDEDGGVPGIQGQTNDLVTSNMLMTLDYSNYPAGFFLPPDDGRQDLADTFTPGTNAAPLFTATDSGRTAGMRYDPGALAGGGRVVFLSFPLDAVPAADTNNPSPNNRAALMHNALGFLCPGLNSPGSISFNSPGYAINATAVVAVSDNALIGRSSVTVNVRSSTDSNGVPILLPVSAQPGVFRGTVTLVAATNSPAPGTLRVQNGDTLTAQYQDVFVASTVTATATVSASLPGTVQITNNLWEARFALTGPTNYSGKGVNVVLFNAPPGQYFITFSNVAYYNTPSPQTNTLASGGNLVFFGNYTFGDSNSNGISDAWEQAYFGQALSNHTAAFDTDGDGVSDYAEFIAGTDPQSTASALRLTATVTSNHFVRLQWPTVVDHAYRLDVNSNGFSSWPPITSWAQATTNVSTQIMPATNPASFYRVEVQP